MSMSLASRNSGCVALGRKSCSSDGTIHPRCESLYCLPLPSSIEECCVKDVPKERQERNGERDYGDYESSVGALCIHSIDDRDQREALVRAL